MKKLITILSRKLPAAAALATIALFLSFGTVIRGSLTAAWGIFRIPALDPSFADTRTVTHSIDCLLTGQDPYVVRNFDPWNRVYNYPPIWLDLRYLGVTSRSTNFLGVFMALLLASSFILLFSATRPGSALVVFFAIFSGPVLFAMERGNIDQVLFALLVFGFFLIERTRDSARIFFECSLIVVLTILKIFPIAAVVVMVKNRHRLLTAALAAVVSVAALLATCGRDLPKVFANTPRAPDTSFGGYTFFVAIGQAIHGFPIAWKINPRIALIGSLVLALLSVIAGLKYRTHLDKFLPSLDFYRARGCIAVSCLAIYVFVFFGGANFNYRLIFLLGVVGYLVEDMEQTKTSRSLLPAVAIVFFCLIPFRHVLLREVLDGLIFCVACAWLSTQLFDRIKARSDLPAFLPVS
jgi:Glycosyltransferase family 87